MDPEHGPLAQYFDNWYADMTGSPVKDEIEQRHLAWRAAERAMWAEAAALDPGDDPALRSFRDEGVRSLETFGLVRRVMATASAP
jgi:hypothetical protein